MESSRRRVTAWGPITPPAVGCDGPPPQRGLISGLLRPGVRQGILVLFDQGIQSASTFLTGILVARSVTKTEYGFFTVYISLILIAQGVQQSLFAQPCTVFAPKMKGLRRCFYLGSTATQQVVFALVLTAALGAAGTVMWVIGGLEGAEIAWLLCATVGAVSFRPVMRSLLLSCFQHRWAFLMNSGASVLQGLLVALLFVGQSLGTAVALTVIAGTSGLCSSLSLALAWRRGVVRFKWRFLAEDLKRNWRLGKWGLGRTMTSTFSGTVYPIALAAFLTPADAAVFGVCAGLAGVINPAVMGVAAFLGPRMAFKAHHLGVAAVVTSTRRMMLVAAGLLVVYVVLVASAGPTLVSVLYGAQYADLGLLLALMAVAVAVESVASPADVAINALERPSVLFYSRLLASVFSVTIGVGMLRLWGSLGAALGLLVGNLMTSSTRVGWLLRRASGVARKVLVNNGGPRRSNNGAASLRAPPPTPDRMKP